MSEEVETLIILYIVLYLLFAVAPIMGKIVLFVLNLYIPDPIPFIDEIVMFASITHKIYFISDQWENHKLRTILIGIFIVLMIFVIL